ncbi:hypothetical protein CC79DRAFT_1317401 [Sarocladium strictum]
MNLRRDHTSEECPDTCQWLLETDEWTQWRQSFEVAECPRLLWIKGHAGSGKSTIMKYAYEHALRSTENDEEIVLVHFFAARAKKKLDKSIEGMYRTILVQLLEELQASYIPGDVARRALRGQVNWDVETLLALFREILRAQADRPVTCFVDALDECDEGQVRDMILRFRDLMEKESRGVRVQLRVLFSSRNYPRILTPPPDKAICMALENQPGHTRDITNYIESKLQVDESPIAQEVKLRVQEKAKGSFIWCKLVIDLLNKDNDEARLDRTLYLRERLAGIPPELDALFAEILGMNREDQVSNPETILCLQWVLFSMRELAPQELWWAIRRGVEPQAESTELAARCGPEYLKRYILRVSRGLVETVKDRYGEPMVQVVHESVRDFLLGQGKLAKFMGLEARKVEALARSHEQIKRICWNELFVHAAHISIPQVVLENIYSDETDDVEDNLAEELPLLWYATQHMVKHANAAQRCGVTSIDQQQFLDDLDRRSEHFNKLRIAAGNQCASSFSKQVDANLTEILLDANAEALIELQYHRLDAAGVATHTFGLEAGFGVSQALRQGGCDEAVEAVVDVHLRGHGLGDSRRDLLLAISPTRPFDNNFLGPNFDHPLFDLADNNPHLGFFFLVAALPVTRDANELLDAQPQGILGHFNALLLFVLENPLQTGNFQDSLDLEEALRWAACQGDVVTAQILLDKYHVDINSSPSNWGTPLHYAAGRKHETMIELLLARDGIELDLRDNYNQTPLHRACRFPVGSSTCNIPDKRIAACGIVRRLLATGKVDVNARNSNDETPLHVSIKPGGRQCIAEMLLDTGKVDVNFSTKDGEKPQDLALRWRNKRMARLLADYNGG